MFDVLASRDFNGAERGRMLIEHLTIDLSAALANSWQKTSSAVFEAFTARENIDSPQNSVPCATPYMPPTSSAFPDFDGVRVAKLMKLVVGGNDIAGYPCPFMTVLAQPSMT
jgi:hypothetical protein